MDIINDQFFHFQVECRETSKQRFSIKSLFGQEYVPGVEILTTFRRRNPESVINPELTFPIGSKKGTGINQTVVDCL